MICVTTISVNLEKKWHFVGILGSLDRSIHEQDPRKIILEHENEERRPEILIFFFMGFAIRTLLMVGIKKLVRYYSLIYILMGF